MRPHRSERLAEQLRIELSELISQEVHDPRVGLVTVSEVKLSPDSRDARVFVSVMGTPEEERESIRAIQHAAHFLRHALAEAMSLRHVPELHFVLDSTDRTGERVEVLLDRIKKSGGS